MSFGIGWIITNGWSYLVFGLGIWLNSEILIGIGGAYLAFLWLPISPEKVVTFAIGFFLVRRLFPKHYHSLRTQIEEATREEPHSSSANSADGERADVATDHPVDPTHAEQSSDDRTSE